MNDMNGRIDAVVDGGECRVGLESTVITLVPKKPRLLRPGGITVEDIESVIGEIDIDDAVLNKLRDGEQAASPGMKYKHYAPKARVVLIKGSDEAFADYVNSHSGKEVAALCYEEDKALTVPVFSLGKKGDYSSQAHLLFDSLREIDKKGGLKLVYARCPETDGVGLAVYNRLIRAAGFEVIDLEKI
jgi:L-threonylcarbamoyladenylate synthase